MNGLSNPIRRLWRSPWYLSLATLTLGLGIGAAAAFLSVVDAAFWRPLPYPADDRIVVIQPVRLDNGKAVGLLPGPLVRAVIQHRGLELVSHVQPLDLVPMLDNVAETWRGASINANVQALFAVRPVAGRLLAPEDFQRDASDAVLVSRTVWRSRFGGNPQVLGRTIACEGRSVRLVGVYEDFTLPAFPKPLTPLFLLADRRSDADVMDDGVLTPFARMRPGWSYAQVESGMRTQLGEVATQYPQIFSIAGMKMSMLRDYTYRDQRTIYVLLLCAACGTVLITWLNLTNLVLTRQRFKRRELAIQAAVGASRLQLWVGVLAQNLWVATFAVPVGLAVAQAICVVTRLRIPSDLSQTFIPVVDWRTGLVASVLAYVIAVLVSILAASDVWRSATPSGLLPGNLGGASRRTTGRKLLIAVQTGAVLALLVASGVMIRSVVKLERLDLGVDAADVFVFSPKLPLERFGAARTLNYWRTLLERASEEPAMVSAAIAHSVPMQDQTLAPWASLVGRGGNSDFREAGGMIPVTAGYFETLHIPLRQGRTFTSSEDSGGLHVAVVNESAARRFWPGVPVLGQVFRSPWFPGPFRVIGVVPDSRFNLNLGAIPMMYVPIWHERPTALKLIVRTSWDARQASSWIALHSREIEPSVAAPAVVPYRELLSKWSARPAFLATVLSMLASLTLAMAAVGIAAVVGYSVLLRYRELGIRLALGASRRAIHRLILKEALAPTTAGVVVGLAAAVALTRLLRQEVYGISTNDPITYVLGALVLVLTVAASAYVPARWAGELDPNTMLRND
jgi:putative ABC transport system permease protein